MVHKYYCLCGLRHLVPNSVLTVKSLGQVRQMTCKVHEMSLPLVGPEREKFREDEELKFIMQNGAKCIEKQGKMKLFGFWGVM